MPQITNTDVDAFLVGTPNNTNKVNLRARIGAADAAINTGDNASNSLYSGLVTNATHTGDATGATALTLATVNSNVGTFTNATVTVNAKGLVTAASSGTSSIADGALTIAKTSGLQASLDGKSSRLHHNAAANLMPLAEHLRIGRSVDIAIAGDSTGSGSTTVGNSSGWRWPRHLAQTLADKNSSFGVDYYQITANAGKAWTKTEIVASPNGELREHWLPEVTGIGEWVTATPYVAGNWVKVTGSQTRYYFCVTSHTSTTAPAIYSSPTQSNPNWVHVYHDTSLMASGELAAYIHDPAATGDKSLTTKTVEIVVDFVMPTGMTAQRSLWGKRASTESNGMLYVHMWPTKYPILFWWDGSVKQSATPTAPLPVADGTRLKLRIRFNPDNGTNRTTEFAYSTLSGSAWSAYTVFSTVTAAKTSWLVPGGSVQLGGFYGGTATHPGIIMYGASVRRGITDADPVDFDLPIDCYSSYGTKDRAMLGSPKLRVWSGSWSGATLENFLGDSFIVGSTYFDIQKDFPSPGNIVATFVNFGHNGQSNVMVHGKNAAAYFKRIATAMQTRFPATCIIGMTQNPGVAGTNPQALDYAPSEADKALRHVYEQQAAVSAGHGWFDINAAFAAYDTPADLLTAQDGLHPNATGSALWAATIADEIPTR